MERKESKGTHRGEGKQRGDLCVQVTSLDSQMGSLWIRGAKDSLETFAASGFFILIGSICWVQFVGQAKQVVSK